MPVQWPPVMDVYTQETKIWLDNRFKRCDEHGIYYAHQPIYGFRKGHSAPDLMGRYIRSYQILRALSHLRFDSLVDVGGAEGYTAYLASQLFGVKVRNSDLSEEACRRAEEIFHIESIPADVHDLPFKNNEFHVALCSETLEHVRDVHKAIEELLRVARKAVVITVPHEPKALIDKNIGQGIPHAHIHSFDLQSLRFLESAGYRVLARKMVGGLLRVPGVLIEAMPREHTETTRYPKVLLHVYNAAVPVARKVLGNKAAKKAAAFLMRADGFVCKFTSSYNAILFIILKDSTCWTKEQIRNISAYRMIEFGVPYHYLSENT